MRDAVRAAGVKTVVSFVLRWNPLFQKLKKMIDGGAFGRTYYVEADYLSYNGSWWSGWDDARTVAARCQRDAGGRLSRRRCAPLVRR